MSQKKIESYMTREKIQSVINNNFDELYSGNSGGSCGGSEYCIKWNGTTGSRAVLEYNYSALLNAFQNHNPIVIINTDNLLDDAGDALKFRLIPMCVTNTNSTYISIEDPIEIRTIFDRTINTITIGSSNYLVQ